MLNIRIWILLDSTILREFKLVTLVINLLLLSAYIEAVHNLCVFLLHLILGVARTFEWTFVDAVLVLYALIMILRNAKLFFLGLFSKIIRIKQKFSLDAGITVMALIVWDILLVIKLLVLLKLRIPLNKLRMRSVKILWWGIIMKEIWRR